jgi:hypothetical protein
MPFGRIRYDCRPQPIRDNFRRGKRRAAAVEPAALRPSVKLSVCQCGVSTEFPDASAAIVNAATLWPRS